MASIVSIKVAVVGIMLMQRTTVGIVDKDCSCMQVNRKAEPLQAKPNTPAQIQIAMKCKREG